VAFAGGVMSGEPSLTIVGLGPAGLERLPERVRALLDDPGLTVIARTLEHPAAGELADRRQVVGCDDLYESGADFEAVYAAIADRVMAAAAAGPTAYVVPGSAVVGEKTVATLRHAAADAGLVVDVVAGESFLDLVYDRVGVDPIADGVQVVDGRNLPDPFPLHLPTVITQVDRLVVLAETASSLGRVLRDNTPVTVLTALGSSDESVATVPLSEMVHQEAGPRTTVFLDPPPAGWHGLVTTNRTLRSRCPWDREQTHHSLVSHLVEEAYETVEALSRLSPQAPQGEPDFGAYAEVEEELGDLLLQVVFHATLAAEVGAFDVEEVAEGIRRKLVRRHPHVFGDVEASTPHQVLANWEHLKAEEKDRESLMDDVPAALPAISRADKMQRRAASVGFDWNETGPVLAKLREELGELEEALSDPDRAAAELGDLLFAAVNLARHLHVDAELALRRAADTFADRFREIERIAALRRLDLGAMSLEEMDELWRHVKENEAGEDDSVSRK
jgi:tetrapyrrole methylase family protein/MazG family protein